MARIKKKPELPTELLEIIEEVKKKEQEQEREELEQIKKEVIQEHTGWDIPLNADIDYFDADLSYEITGYRPINKTRGLDFNPDWFTEARETFLRTGHYTTYPRNTKAYADFWDTLYTRCRNGMTVNGYTITGDHYFFLNFYQLMDLTSAKKAGSSRMYDFPKFSAGQYQFFHYIELARVLRRNAVLMKARGVGYSEINAAIIANSYNCRRNSVNVLAALLKNYLDKTNSKIEMALNFLNDYTDGGFFKLRQVHDSDYFKKSSYLKRVGGQEVEAGFMSQIQCILADKPNKIRGDRTDLLVYEELGSWPQSKKAFIQGDALVGIQGARFGLKLGGGTGGDSGPALEGLRDMYYNPGVYDILAYRHKYTQTGEQVTTAYFIPVFTVMTGSPCTDARGWTDPVKGKEYYDKERASKSSDPNALLIYQAEYCYNAEEAFSLEGVNNFDKTIIAEQLAAIRLLKTAPKIEDGNLSFIYKSTQHNETDIAGFRWQPIANGKVHILEHPIWSDEYRNLMKGEANTYSEMNNLYVAGVDSIDIGLEDTSENTDNPSNFCIVIMRRLFGTQDPVIVAYYKDRPKHIRDAYKIAMCLIKYYNAVVNIEATRVNFLAWAREHKCYLHFMLRPRATYPDPTKITKRTPGTPSTSSIIDHLLKLVEAYIEDYGHHIWFEEMLDELSRYSLENKTHFDIVAALGMLMLADEELGELVATKTQNKDNAKAWVWPCYYTDEHGYKRYGIPPTTLQPQDIIIKDNFWVENRRSTSWDDW